MTESSEPSLQKDAVSAMHKLIFELAKALVDDVNAVKVDVLNDNESAVLRLHVSQSDIGKVIGKQGRTARSLRTILSAASMKYQQRFALDIVEAGGGVGRHHNDDEE